MKYNITPKQYGCKAMALRDYLPITPDVSSDSYIEKCNGKGECHGKGRAKTGGSCQGKSTGKQKGDCLGKGPDSFKGRGIICSCILCWPEGKGKNAEKGKCKGGDSQS